jgi:hypothetical protein
MPRDINPWAMYPRKTSTASLPEALNMEVTIKAHELIETGLKPKYIQPPLEKPQFNYIVDIYGKWYHKAFYFCADYRVAGPNPREPSFEAKFARMQYAGNRRFQLSFMRHTGQWIQLYTDLMVDECIETIRDDPLCWLLMISAEQIASFPRQLLVCSRLICSLSEAWGVCTCHPRH